MFILSDEIIKKKPTLYTLKQFDANVPQFSNHVIFKTSLR